MIFPAVALSSVMFNFYECLASAVSRGVKVRVVTQKTDLKPAVARKLGNLVDNPNFEIKFVTYPIDVGLIILNGQEVNICLSEGKEVPSLWTNNVQILKITQEIFENQWDTNQNFLIVPCKKGTTIN